MPCLTSLLSRACDALRELRRTGLRHPLLAGLFALSVACIVLRFLQPAEALELGAFAVVLCAISLVDVERRIIPNGLVALASAIRLAYLLGMVAAGQASPFLPAYAILSAIGVATALACIAFVAEDAFGRASIGGGDIKLFAVAALYVGWQRCTVVIMLSCLLAIAYALSEAGGRGRFLDRTVPFGPCISLSCIAVMLWLG